MFHDIETALRTRILSRLAPAPDTQIRRGKKGAEGLLVPPSVTVSVEEGRFKQVGQRSFRADIDVYVEISFSDLRSGADRRKGMFLVLTAVLQAAMLQDLGLGIAPLSPVKFANAEADSPGGVTFLLHLATSFTLEKIDDEEITDLATLGLEYLLKPGDDAPDASDVVDLT